MRGVRGAAAIAAGQDFVTRCQATNDNLSRAIQRLVQIRQSAKGGDGIVDGPLQESHGISLRIGR